MKKYIISFGDSDKYYVNFEGSLEEFKKSAKLEDIKRIVSDYLKKDFPGGGYSDAVDLNVYEDEQTDCRELDKNGIESLLNSVKKQVEVKNDTGELNNNAPYDEI